MKYRNIITLSTGILLAVIFFFLGVVDGFNILFLKEYFRNLSIAIITVTGAYSIYLLEIDNKSKEKFKFFQSKLDNLLYELNSNIKVPQQYSDYFRDNFLTSIENDKISIKFLNKLDKNDPILFFDNFFSQYLKELRKKNNSVSIYDVYNKIISKNLIEKRPVITIDIEEKILDSVISDLEFYGSKFKKLRNYLGEVKHSCQVARANQKILLYNSGDKGYLKYAVLKALIIQMQYSDLFRKRIKLVVEEILKINPKTNLNDFGNLKKEFEP